MLYCEQISMWYILGDILSKTMTQKPLLIKYDMFLHRVTRNTTERCVNYILRCYHIRERLDGEAEDAETANEIRKK